jgi:hypothetical protein
MDLVCFSDGRVAVGQRHESVGVVIDGAFSTEEHELADVRGGPKHMFTIWMNLGQASGSALRSNLLYHNCASSVR